MSARESFASMDDRGALEPSAYEEARVQHLLYPTADDWARVKATHIKADPGEQAEYRHWLHDADPDSTVPPFVDLTKRTRSQS